MISVVDYGIGNIGSVLNMLRHVGARARSVGTPAEIDAADALILPGVGAFDYAMNTLRQRGLDEPLRRAASERRIPLLGICLGMQLLSNGSEEGNASGLGLIDADFVKFRFPSEAALKVPHMGWNTVAIERANPLLDLADGEQRFYFVHSYYARCNDPADVVATCDHGNSFVAVYGHDNVYGVQFHPEKSHKFGMRLLRNFLTGMCSINDVAA